MPRYRKTHRLSARAALVSLIEKYAVKHHIKFSDAAPIVVADPQHFELMLQAVGSRYTGSPPELRTISPWKDQRKLDVAKLYPNLTPEQLEWVAPYLHPDKRKRPA